MSTLTLDRAPPFLGRALLVLLGTLLAHALALEGVRRTLDGAAPPRGERSAVSARLLPAPPRVTPEPVPPVLPVPQPVSKARPRPRPRATTAPAAAAPLPPAESPATDGPVAVAAEPVIGPGGAEPASVAEVGAAPGVPPPVPADEPESPAAALNAERPVEYNAAVEAEEFEATGGALRALFAPLPSLSSALPPAARYLYRTTNSELRLATGTTTVDWALDADGRYTLRLATAAIGLNLLEIESSGTLRDFGLAPERYTEARIRRGTVAANFDWDGRRVTFSARTHERPLPDGVQDRLSFQFQLMLLGQALPERFRAGARTVLRVAGRDDVDVYRFRSAGRDTTGTGIGMIDTVRIERIADDPAQARIDVWLAPDLGWLPVRLRFTDRHGRVTESTLEAVEAS